MFKGLDFIIISLLAWGLGYFGQPHISVRFMAADSNQTISKARRTGIRDDPLFSGTAVVGFWYCYFEMNPQAGAVT